MANIPKSMNYKLEKFWNALIISPLFSSVSNEL